MDTKRNKKPLREIVAEARTKPTVDAKPETPTTGLIKAATENMLREAAESERILETLAEMADLTGTDVNVLGESVTSLLANIAIKAEQGEPLELMHISSIAAFMAGVEAIADALPTASDEEKVQNTLRVLATAAIEDGTANRATYPIVNLGARKVNRHKSYLRILNDYAASQTRGEPQGEIVMRAARILQMKIDRAVVSARRPRPAAAAGPSRPGSAPRG